MFRGMRKMYARVIGFEKSNFDAFIFEVSLCLSKVDRSMVGRSVPFSPSVVSTRRIPQKRQDRPVGQKGNLVSGHGVYFSIAEKLLLSVFPCASACI